VEEPQCNGIPRPLCARAPLSVEGKAKVRALSSYNDVAPRPSRTNSFIDSPFNWTTPSTHSICVNPHSRQMNHEAPFPAPSRQILPMVVRSSRGALQQLNSPLVEIASGASTVSTGTSSLLCIVNRCQERIFKSQLLSLTLNCPGQCRDAACPLLHCSVIPMVLRGWAWRICGTCAEAWGTCECMPFGVACSGGIVGEYLPTTHMWFNVPTSVDRLERPLSKMYVLCQ